jgi:preprotein translocase subunit SecE
MRWLAVIGGVVLGIAVFASSKQGSEFWQFMLDSRIELRKIVWPSRQETGMTTLVVFGFVIVAGLFFWVLDLVLAWATRALTGQGG